MKGIYGKESSFGRNDGCKNKGMVNGFGFMQSTFMWECFDNFTEVAQKVDQWLDDHLKLMSINEALCYYNKGLKMENCSYAEDVLSLSN